MASEMVPIAQNIEAVTLILGTVTLNRAYDQTVEEWLEEYATGVPVIPAAWTKVNASASARASAELVATGVKHMRSHLNACSAANVHDIRPEPLKLFYDTFRTTKNGRLAVVLTDRATDLEYISWFNVLTSAQRGDRKTKTGHKGYFYPPERSKFRKFWQKYICPAENVWGSIYRKLPSRFPKLVFTGSVELKKDSRGCEYWQVNELSVLQQRGA